MCRRCHRTVPHLSGIGSPVWASPIAMLGEGLRRKERGADVVVGFVECHGRQRTEELHRRPGGRPPAGRRLPGHRTSRRWTSTPCSARHPEVVLVDESAHTNVPGSGRHEKRWQDVEGPARRRDRRDHHRQHPAPGEHRRRRGADHRGAGRTSGSPTGCVRKADQIELVDSSPEQLRRRMVHGNIYPPEQGPRGPHPLLPHRQPDRRCGSWPCASWPTRPRSSSSSTCGQQRNGVVWETHERILVGVTTAPGTDAIVRRASRMASRIKADLEVLHVARSEDGPSRFPDDQTDHPAPGRRRRRRRVERSPQRRPGPGPHRLRPDRGTSPRSWSARAAGRGSQELFGGGSVVRKIARLAAPRRASTCTSSPAGMPPSIPAHRWRWPTSSDERYRSRRCPGEWPGWWEVPFSRCRWPRWSAGRPSTCGLGPQPGWWWWSAAPGVVPGPFPVGG